MQEVAVNLGAKERGRDIWKDLKNTKNLAFKGPTAHILGVIIFYHKTGLKGLI